MTITTASPPTMTLAKNDEKQRILSPRKLLLTVGTAVCMFVVLVVSMKQMDRSPSTARVRSSSSSATVQGEVVNTNDSKKADKRQSPTPPLEVAWIMSFGGSGTSYTVLNTEFVSGCTTASNYAANYDPLVPVRPEYVNGPYLRSPDKPLPPRYILTKTHCGGYCMDCPPTAYLLDPEPFQQSCLLSQRSYNATAFYSVLYSPDIPKRAVHLIRNPFDNLVGRMHLFDKHRVRDPDRPQFNTTEEGLAEWCQYLDHKYHPLDIRSGQIKPYIHVPCHAEWFRYVQWHNRAWQVTQNLSLPVHYLYYDDYAGPNYTKALTDLLEFLELPRQTEQSLRFLPSHTYRTLFSEDHAKAAMEMVQQLAEPAVWKLLAKYF